MNKLKSTIEKIGKMTPVTAPKPIAQSTPTEPAKAHYRKKHKTGPELLVTKILMVNGPLTSKEIWRIYERTQAENRAKGIEEQAYWPSLTKLKETIKFMRTNEKIVTNGYSYRDHIFRGWKLQEKRALQYVHPSIIRKIQQEISKRDSL